MRFLRITVLVVLCAVSAVDDESLVIRWNAFAEAANRYINTVDVNPVRRAKAKRHLNDLWQRVYDCDCF